MSTVSAPLIYRIDQIEVDAVRGCIRHAGREIHVRTKTFSILLYLLAHRDRLITKEELMTLFWKDTAVTDDALAQCIAELRRALGDSARTPLYLKTIPKVGYRFLGEVQEVRPAGLIATEQITTVQIQEEYTDEPPLQIAPPRPRYRLLWIAATLIGVVALTAGWLWHSRAGAGLPPVAAGKRQIAVLRFENRSGQSDLDWLRDGLPDMLTTTLSRSDVLDVLSREQASLWLGRIGDTGLRGALELARRSHVQAAVLGSFARLGNSIRIDARIYDARSGSMLAAESITAEKPEQVLRQVDYLAARLAGRLASRTAGQDSRVLSSLMTDNLEAYRYYSLGLEKAEGMQTEDSVQLFEKAVALDPNFAMAYARIGYAYAVPANRQDEGRPYLEKAFRMSGKLTGKDRRHIVAWYAIANRDYQEAIHRYSELISAYPNETEPYYRLAYLLRGEARHDEAVDILRQALAIDPEDPKLYNAASSIVSEVGRHQEAIAMAERYVTLAPADANAYDSLALSYQGAGLYEKAIAAFDKAREVKPDFEIASLHRAIAWAQMGREREALHEFASRGETAAFARTRARYWQQAAWLYWRRGRLAEARGALARSYRDWTENFGWNPAEPPPAQMPTVGRDHYAIRAQYFYLAQRARIEHHPEEMLANLRRALQHTMQWAMPEPLEDALADAWFEQGRLDDAIAEYERALKVFPGMARARFHLAQAYQRKGRQEEAKAQFRRFLELWAHADPDLPELAEARRTIGR